MRVIRFGRLFLVVTLLGALSCGGGGGGGGSSSTGGGGSLRFRAMWEHRDDGSAGTTSPEQPGEITRGAFGPDLPAAVKTARVVFDSATLRCCLAVAPDGIPVDPETGRRSLVLDALPTGPANLEISGYPTNFAPAPEGITALCATVPANVGQACDPSQVSTPSFDSQLHQVTIVGGADNDAGTIEVLAVPFVLQPVPAPGTSTTNPVAVSFTVADASTGIDRSSIAASVRQGGGPAQNIGLTLTPCNDSGSTPCSQDVQLGVTGFHVTGVAPTLGSGTAEMHIRADNLASPPALLDFLYAFTVVVPTPTAVPTPTEPRATPTASTPITLVLPAGADIGEAAKRLPPGSTLIVSPGVYAPVDIGPDELRGPITLLGDAGGALTNSSGTAVVVNGRGRAAAIRLSSQADVVIDGFTVRGGSEAGLLLINSPGVTVRNCVMKVNRGDGVQLQQSDGVVVFNNLIWDNDGAGISVRDSNAVRLINNTVYRNTRAGIVVGDQGEGASDTDARDNIIDQNTAPGLVVNPSATGFFGDFNLNNDGYQGTDPGFHDIVGLSPLFIYPTGEDFHLQAFTGGTISPAVDAGDFDLEAEFVDALQQRVSRSDGLLDVPPVELGYHYLPPVATPTPRPRPTSTPTPSPARTTSPTRTPTR